MSRGDLYVTVNFMFQYVGTMRIPKLKFSSPLITHPIKMWKIRFSTLIPLLALRENPGAMTVNIKC
jgi:hypothetical protein